MAESYHETYNANFINFTTVPNDIVVEFDGVDQNSNKVMQLLMERKSAKKGYGVGYAGTPVAGNISWDGPDVPFSTLLKNIPWGRAVLCQAEYLEATEGTEDTTDPDTGEVIPGEPAQPAKISLRKITDKSGRPAGINGVCYGTNIKSNSVQIDCGFSVGLEEYVNVSPDNEGRSTLVLAVFANVVLEGDALVTGKGDSVVAISSAVDPTIFRANGGVCFQFAEDAVLRRGFSFTVRGNFMLSPFCKAPSAHTSLYDLFTNIPVIAVTDGTVTQDLFSEDD